MRPSSLFTAMLRASAVPRHQPFGRRSSMGAFGHNQSSRLVSRSGRSTATPDHAVFPPGRSRQPVIRCLGGHRVGLSPLLSSDRFQNRRRGPTAATTPAARGGETRSAGWMESHGLRVWSPDGAVSSDTGRHGRTARRRDSPIPQTNKPRTRNTLVPIIPDGSLRNFSLSRIAGSGPADSLATANALGGPGPLGRSRPADKDRGARLPRHAAVRSSAMQATVPFRTPPASVPPPSAIPSTRRRTPAPPGNPARTSPA